MIMCFAYLITIFLGPLWCWGVFNLVTHFRSISPEVPSLPSCSYWFSDEIILVFYLLTTMFHIDIDLEVPLSHYCGLNASIGRVREAFQAGNRPATTDRATEIIHTVAMSEAR